MGSDRFQFEVLERDGESEARCGLLRTPHGEIATPVFMPVGTAGSVKGVPQHLLEELDARIILANTYHLHLRPGAELIRDLGGLHRFMAWERAILTDSGGYQVFSHRELRSISEEGVHFRSHLDGSRHFLSPERAIEIQQALGADIIMAFDDCTPYPVEHAEARESMLRSMRWARRCRQVAAHPDQALFGIVQGGMFADLRRESLEQIMELEFPGVALGGFSVGEPRELMWEVVAETAHVMPDEKPRYLMGVGAPLDLLDAVALGLDMFDCVLPTRNGRNGTVFTSQGLLRIKNARHRADSRALDADCGCRVCRRYSRAYLRHLYVAGEMLAGVLLTLHNLHFYLDLMARIRQSISLRSFGELRRELHAAYAGGP